MGEHRHLLRLLQSTEGQPDAGRGGHDVEASAAAPARDGTIPREHQRTKNAGIVARLSVLERRFRRRVSERHPDVAETA